jgi:uncharacterized membrane protein YkvA (DUF1232 family)
MSEKKPGDIMASPSRGMVKEMVLRLKLILRLMGDSRVNFFVKLLPVASLAYVIWPIDLISAIPFVSALDDVAIAGLGVYLFMELCPPNVVQEHMKSLTSNLETEPSADEIVDAETTDLPPDEKK